MVKKREMTKIECQHRRFDILSKIVIFVMSGLMVAFCVLFLFANSGEFQILFGLLLILGTATIIFVAPQIVQKRESYLQQLCDERNEITRTGLFKDVYEAYKHDEFEFNLFYDKLLYEEYHNNIIDIGVLKNNHEFLIEIDEKVITITVDEETDHTTEEQIPLSGISTMEYLYLIINEIISRHSLH